MTTPLAWVPALHGHELALDGTDLKCRKTNGQIVKSVPSAVRTSPVGERFAALREHLVRHEKECRAGVESWLLSGVPVPAQLLARVWPDPDWRTTLRHLVVSVDGRIGLLEEVSEDGRVRLREADGTLYEPPIGSPVTLAHPVLLGDLGPWRRLLEEYGAAQGVEQLNRRVHRRLKGCDPEATGIDVHAETFGSARPRAVQNGFDVRGGFAVQRMIEVEARCWLGDDEAGRLLWVDEAERPVPLGEVGPVAWSEGRRMADLIYGGADPQEAEDTNLGEHVAAAPDVSSALTAGLAPAGTPGGEEITARRYHHPLLGARPVIRLTGRTVAPLEDRLLADAGYFAPDVGEPVAAGHRPALRYPAWALVHDHANAGVALSAGVEMARAGRMAGPRPGPALEEFQRIAATLPADHLPLFWEEAGRMFIAAGRDKQGALQFARARKADRHAAKSIDPARRRAVFLEFALAGALPAKDIKAYVGELSQGPDPVAAYGELRELALRRTTGGLAPWPEMLAQIGKLAKAAKLDVVTEHRLLLESLMDAPALWRSADGFWTAQRKLLLPVVAASAALRKRLTWRLTEAPPSEMDAWWFDLLKESGALDDLAADAGEWLSAMLGRYSGVSSPSVPEELLRLLPQLAGRIREAGTPVRFDVGAPDDYHNIDAVALASCLEVGIPLADPGPAARLRNWQGPAQVDLQALIDDERFGPVLVRSVPGGGDEFRKLWVEKALQPALRASIDAELGRGRSRGLADAAYALRWMEDNLRTDMPKELPDLLDRIAKLDMVTPLTRTLRAGILDELGWAALDEAATELKGKNVWCRASWPVLTVHDRRKAIAIGPGGRIAEHQLRVPSGAGQFSYTPEVYFSGGQFLVLHYVNGRQQHYWSNAPDKIFTVRPGMWKSFYHEPEQHGYTFMAPNGRRFMGHKVLDHHEERLGPNGHMFHDGRDFWWHAKDGLDSQVHLVDLATGELEEEDLPDFFDPSLLGENDEWDFESSSLAPLPRGVKGSPLGSDGTHVGLLVARDRVTRQVRYHRIDDVHGVLDGAGITAMWGLLDIPGAERRLILSGGVRRYDPVRARDAETGELYWQAELKNDGWTDNEPDLVAAGTRLIPRPAFWHFLEPRDPAGSQALRQITEDTVRLLLKAAATSEEALSAAIGKLLPEVSHPLLVRGIAGCVQEARELISHRGRILARLKRPRLARIRVSEEDLGGALDGLVSQYSSGYHGTATQIELTSAFFTGAIDAETAMERWQYNWSAFDWTELPGRIGGLAVRAVSAVTSAEHRRALARLLRFWALSPLAEPGLRRGLLDEEQRAAFSDENGTLMPLSISMLYSDWGEAYSDVTSDIAAFLQRGTVPGPAGLFDVQTVPEGWATPERLHRLVGELERSGPVPFDPGAAARLAEATGLDDAAAALLMTGLPHIMDDGHNFLPPETRQTLGLKVTDAKTARDRLRRVPAVAYLELYDAAMPDDPTGLWDQAAMADRLAAAWTAVKARP
ncbi:DUF4132 domain-containing protein [Nonomuraea sp. NPDC046802]|uniref:DUF4132 domain-containing protein n=1 Tax=Nonomuraea sp. NPDC046802 TaxID=3154919 RepID=UPI0033E45847